MDRKKVLAIILLLLAILLVGVVIYIVKNHLNGIAKDEASRTLFTKNDEKNVYTDMEGKEAQIDEYKGKIIVVNVWASWSPFAEIELPILDKLGGEFKDKNVQILAVNRKENPNQAQRFLNTQPSFNNVRNIIDTNDRFYNEVEGYAMPETIIYNAEGVVTSHIHGVINEDELRSILNDLIK